MTGPPDTTPDRDGIAAQMRGRLDWLEQGRTSEQAALFVVETADRAVIYAAESRAIPAPGENSGPEPEAGS